MKKIGFVGVYDNIDFVLYIAKILTEMNKKVLIVDGTMIQKAKYIVPTIIPAKTYITEFEKIDIAIGFQSFNEIKLYFAEEPFEYDVMLINADTVESVENFEIEKCDKNYFVTSFDDYSMKRGLEALAGIKNQIELTKIIYSNDMTEALNDYLNFLSVGLKVKWNDERIYLPFEVGDKAVIYENQKVSKIKFKKLSNQYREQLIFVSEQILILMQAENIKDLRKIFKKI